ncbi:MAG: GNAT family N-acetyltransferase [Acidobacteriota bacterium]|nr:MAG: GNAT family N-acetyltransferase [Acidobacteriota bacterium]
MQVEKIENAAIRTGVLPRHAGVPAISDGRFIAKMVETPDELGAVLRLRRDVFRKELAGSDAPAGPGVSDLEELDLRCEHLIVTEKATGRAVGTYRLNSFETAMSASGFYASNEFHLESVPPGVLERSVELGRACIAKDHRNSRVLFLLWKVLAGYLVARGKRYLFGCCSVFIQDERISAKLMQQLEMTGCLHPSIAVRPREELRIVPAGFDPSAMAPLELPALLNIYLRIGCKVCGEPAVDREMRTVDFFVVFDLECIKPRYRRMFFGGR